MGIQKPQHEVGAYEAGGAGDEEGFGGIGHKKLKCYRYVTDGQKVLGDGVV